MQILILEPDFLRFLGISQILRAEPGITIIGEHDHRTILNLKRPPREINPDVVIVSHALTVEHDISIVAHLQTLFPAAQVLIEGNDEGLDVIADALRAGARGYVVLTGDPKNLVKALNVVEKGSIWAPREAVVRLAQLGPRPILKSETGLTAHELELLTLLRQGMTNKEIARRVGMAEVTIKTHLTKLFRKFGVKTRLELLAYVINHNLLPEMPRASTGNA